MAQMTITSTIPNPLGALSFTFIAKDAGIYHKNNYFETIRGGHLFSRNDPNSFCKLLFYTWGTTH